MCIRVAEVTGSHLRWTVDTEVCLKCYTTDPTGRPPPKRWAKESAWAVIAGCAPDEKTRRRMLKDAVYNKVPHQRENTECGMFSMMCVDALVAGRSFLDHCSLALTDDDAFQNRHVFFDMPEQSGKPGQSGRWSWAQIFGGMRQRKKTHRARTES